MGWFDKFRTQREKRAVDPSWQALAALAPSGQTVNAHAAENLATVLACVQAISSAIGSLPAWVYRTGPSGRAADPAHPLAGLISNGPNGTQTWPDFVEWLIAQTLLFGNGLAEIIADRGELVALLPLPWQRVRVERLPSGRLIYTIADTKGRERRLLDDQVLHLRDRSDDGLIGRSRLSRAAKVVINALTVQDFASSTFTNTVNPSGVLMAEGKLGDEPLKQLRANFREAFSGSSNVARALVLDQGLKWDQLKIVSPEDAELLASRRFGTEELARLYGCPPPIIGDLSHGTFTNSETAGRWFAQHTLTPWIKKIEAAFAKSVFTEFERATHHLEIDLSGFLRGDPETRWKSHEIAVRNNILTADEVRLVEGWSPKGAAQNV